MDFRPSDEQLMISETLSQALADCCTPAQLRALADTPEKFDTARWQLLADLGLPGTLLPEAAGGLGLDDSIFCAAATACGAALLPEPLVSSAGIALPLLQVLSEEADFGSDMLAELAAGDGYAVLAHPDRPYFPHAGNAALIIWAGPDGSLAAGGPECFNLELQPSADPLLPLYSVTPGKTARRLARTPATAAALELARDRGALFTAAQLAGLSRAVLGLAVSHAQERQQFGRAIGSNQAVKHMLAAVEVQLAFLQPVLEAAAALMPRQDPLARRHVANAWLRACDTAELATKSALQVHGAMGYSWECDVQLFLKRALVLRTSRGNSGRHLANLGSSALCAEDDLGALF